MGLENRPNGWNVPIVPIRFARCGRSVSTRDAMEPVTVLLPGPLPCDVDGLFLLGPHGLCGLFEPVPGHGPVGSMKAVGVLLPHVVREIEKNPEAFSLIVGSGRDGIPDDPSQFDTEFVARLDSLALRVEKGTATTPDRFFTDDAVFVAPEPHGRFRLEAGRVPGELIHNPAACLQGDGRKIDVETTTVDHAPFEETPIDQVAEGTFVLIDDRGNEIEFRTDDIYAESDVSIEAHYRFECTPVEPQRECDKKLRLTVHVRVYPGGLVRLDAVLHNTGRARHRGGLWDLGDPGSILFRELVFRVRFAERPKEIVLKETPSAEARRFAPKDDFAWSLFQGGSGGPNPKHPTHVNRHGQVPIREEGYRTILRASGRETSATGKRASPVAAIAWDEAVLEFGAERFWQTFPKSLRITPTSLEFAIFPAEWDDLHELQGGEKKTHTFWLRIHTSPKEHPVETTLDWVHDRLRATLPPSAAVSAVLWDDLMGFEFCETHASVLDEPPPETARILEKWRQATYSGDELEQLRDAFDEYGWRHDGDLPADHEARHYRGKSPLVSHFNNQYDLVYGFLLRSALTGDVRFAAEAENLLRHVADIDTYDTDEDRPSFCGGLFWMTDHYLSAHTATHRAFSKCNATGRGYGGGPSCEHNYTTGALFSEEGEGVVCRAARWVMQMEDGSRTPFFLLDSGPTGLATATSSLDYHGPGRGAANSINALINQWIVGERDAPRYREAAEALIRRTIHPNADIDAWQPADAERRWSYVMYMNVLARYLFWKRRLETKDDMYRYAAASLVRLGRWMGENERPFLDRRNELAFPTEVWAAQDLRKANAMRAASLYADASLRRRLLDRAREIADRAWSDLFSFETYKNVRTTAVVLVEGLRDALWRAVEAEEGPGPYCEDFGEFGAAPPMFVPQKARVKQMLKSPAGWLRLAAALTRPQNVRRLIQLLRQWRN
ncbi:hypothetical protein JCM19992_01250 [Thermostilla marina]